MTVGAPRTTLSALAAGVVTLTALVALLPLVGPAICAVAPEPPVAGPEPPASVSGSAPEPVAEMALAEKARFHRNSKEYSRSPAHGVAPRSHLLRSPERNRSVSR